MEATRRYIEGSIGWRALFSYMCSGGLLSGAWWCVCPGYSGRVVRRRCLFLSKAGLVEVFCCRGRWRCLSYVWDQHRPSDLLTLTLTSIDMMLETKSRQRDRRCAVLSFFFFLSHCGDPFKLPNPCVRIFDDASVFSNSLPFFHFFFLPFLCKWAPAIFHFGNRRSPP